jgi:D-alanyl-D-alanine dipeptidase
MITNGAAFTNYHNFSSTEFYCKCCKQLKISEIVLDFCQAWRNYIQQGVKINSAYRCPEHNNKVSSTGEDGPHTTGMAVDISTSPQLQYKLLDFALHWDPKPTGIGIAKTFTHLDWLTVDVDQKYVVRPNVWKY